MKKGNLFLRTVLSTVSAVLGLAVCASAEDVPEVERVVIKLEPLKFAGVDDEEQGQKLWNELMKYKLWGTDSVVFNKEDFKIEEPSGYTGTANNKVIFNNGKHTLGGPIVSGGDLQFSYPGSSVSNDHLLKGPVHANWLVLAASYNAENTSYEGDYCFEGNVYFDAPNRHENPYGQASEAVNKFIENIHKTGGHIYADWDKDYNDPNLGLFEGLSNLNLDGSYENCPSDVPKPEKNLSVPKFDESGISWEPAVDLNSSYYGEVQYIHIPPITDEDIKNKHTWFDKYIENIHFAGNYGKKLYILMPSSTQNADKKTTGRLTRIFTQKGVNIESSANDTKIQVAYVGSDATWSTESNQWNFDEANITVVADTNYAGNLMFFTNADITWAAMNSNKESDYQGTYVTTGRFMIYDHISVAG
jgi:hypothetical protein